MDAADYIHFTDCGSHPSTHQEARAANTLLIRSVKCLFVYVSLCNQKYMQDFPIHTHKLDLKI